MCEFGAINGEQLIATVPVIVGFCKLAFLTAEQFAAVGQVSENSRLAVA